MNLADKRGERTEGGRVKGEGRGGVSGNLSF